MLDEETNGKSEEGSQALMVTSRPHPPFLWSPFQTPLPQLFPLGFLHLAHRGRKMSSKGSSCTHICSIVMSVTMYLRTRLRTALYVYCALQLTKHIHRYDLTWYYTSLILIWHMRGKRLKISQWGNSRAQICHKSQHISTTCCSMNLSSGCGTHMCACFSMCSHFEFSSCLERPKMP